MICWPFRRWLHAKAREGMGVVVGVTVGLARAVALGVNGYQLSGVGDSVN